jgi:3-oxoacyl-[acyl-carrier protein] reductase
MVLPSRRSNARSDYRQLPALVPAMLSVMNRLEGNVALITGGSRGIGAAVAIRLAEEGADVVLTYENSAERATEVVEHIKTRGRRALAIQADSSVPEALTAAVAAEIAATVAHLASADGAYITGASIHVDGGFTA